MRPVTQDIGRLMNGARTVWEHLQPLQRRRDHHAARPQSGARLRPLNRQPRPSAEDLHQHAAAATQVLLHDDRGRKVVRQPAQYRRQRIQSPGRRHERDNVDSRSAGLSASHLDLAWWHSYLVSPIRASPTRPPGPRAKRDLSPCLRAGGCWCPAPGRITSLTRAGALVQSPAPATDGAPASMTCSVRSCR